jgi:hypothetical protein
MRFQRLTDDQGILTWYTIDLNSGLQQIKVAATELGSVKVDVTTTSHDATLSYAGGNEVWTGPAMITAFAPEDLLTAHVVHDDIACTHRRTHSISAEISSNYSGSRPSGGVMRLICH